jgi:oxygen-independent coproporphyrinogen-3 oxidase
LKPGIYIHIPFCEQRCYYCAFTVVVSREDAYESYVDRVVREIELSEWKEAPETIFMGGGTPSILRGELIGRILESFPKGASEISVEANPGTLAQEKLNRYREFGVNRISLGAQSFHDEDLKSAGRLHRAADVIDDFEALRRHGFSNINVDLIAGLPQQRIELWESNLEWVRRLRPEHVSIYMLELEERSPWSRKVPDIPADEEFVRFYETACERLEAGGYVHYEISNWAQPGYECRHNLKYWTAAPYRGFGVSAHSFQDGKRFWNSASLSEYAAQIDAGRLPISGEEILTSEIRLEEAFMLGLRQMRGFNVYTVAEELGIRYSSQWFDRVEALRQGGLVEFSWGVLKLTPAGCLVATGITEELLWPSPLSISGATL